MVGLVERGETDNDGFYATLVGAEAVDEYTVRIMTDGPDGVLPARMYWLKQIPASAEEHRISPTSPSAPGPTGSRAATRASTSCSSPTRSTGRRSVHNPHPTNNHHPAHRPRRSPWPCFSCRRPTRRRASEHPVKIASHSPPSSPSRAAGRVARDPQPTHRHLEPLAARLRAPARARARATSSSTSRAILRRTTAASSTSGAGATAGTATSALGRTTPTGEGGARALRRPRRRAARAAPRICTSSTTRRTRRPSCARCRSSTRRARTRSTSCCATGARRPLRRRAPGPAGRRGELLAQEARAPPRLSCASRRRVREGGGSIVAYETWLETGERRAARGDPRLQRGGLPLDAVPARLAARARCGRRPQREFGVDFDELAARGGGAHDRRMAAGGRGPDRATRRRAAGGRRGRRRRPGRAPPARHLLLYHQRESKPEWWRYFELRDMTSTSLIDERDAIGGLVRDPRSSRRSRQAVARLRVHVSRRRSSSSSLGNVRDPTTGESYNARRGSTDDHVVIRRGKNAPAAGARRARSPAGRSIGETAARRAVALAPIGAR